MKLAQYTATAFKVTGLALALIIALVLASRALAVVTEYSASIVKVTNAAGTGGGTGFVTRGAEGNVIVTNAHVCEVAVGGYAHIQDDNGQPYIKRILRESFERDLCVLEGINAPALPLADRDPSRFDKLQVYGHPGLRPTAPASGYYTGPGIVPIGFSPNAKGECPGSATLEQSMFGSYCVLHMELGYSTVPIMPGNSGSPVTNEDGEVVGVMNSADSVGNQGMFIPLNYLKDILAQ